MTKLKWKSVEELPGDHARVMLKRSDGTVIEGESCEYGCCVSVVTADKALLEIELNRFEGFMPKQVYDQIQSNSFEARKTEYLINLNPEYLRLVLCNSVSNDYEEKLSEAREEAFKMGHPFLRLRWDQKVMTW